ncbi:lipopolysaccharide assembly protein LapA domain-containing protein [Mycobacterium sp. MYCO198283]|uniref:LapA family protein n=1 Tax=Mycobacterium sp. MYCO198283 TaxID=2883505 RepID=UPI001E48BF99|nr:lipopolysaccharide assembly protein LapA domain-containing protein [Mycobacterium sp. MYCO198283]MCG5432916.1 lipopolysaccharide assembly protein LapA domain-containing protein [Mycobacterium sp. MYCO198283]
MSSDPVRDPDRPIGSTAPATPPLTEQSYSSAGAVAPPRSTPQSAVHFTRAAALWTAVALGLLVLIVLLIFIAQNTESAQIAFLGWDWTLPLGVAILGAAVLGGLVTVAAGAVRIFQLRRAAKKNLRGGRV